MRAIDADALEELFREVIGGIAKKPEMNDNLEHMVRASAMVIEMIQDAPTIEPERKKGMWIFKERREPVYDISGVKTWGIAYMCHECGFIHTVIEDFGQYVYCPNCGADMRIPVEIARNIVHEVIDNSVWSDAVDPAEMHKVVDDKYAEIRGDANVDANT